MKKLIALAIMIVLGVSTFSYADLYSPYRNGYIEGYVKNISDTKAVIEEYDGTLHTLNLTKDTNFRIDNRDAKRIDFIAGMEIYAAIKSKTITDINSYSSQNPGYIKEDSRLRIGIVKKIDRNMLVIKYANGSEENFYTSNATIALKYGKNVALSSLYEGDRVKLYFSEISSTTISKLEIEGDSILLSGVYRAKINSVNDIEGKLTLEAVESFDNGQWLSLNDMLTVSMKDAPIYTGGAAVLSKNLKNYKGKTVYLAMKNFFGSEKIERLVIKNDYETAYTDKIEDINWFADSFELTGKQNIGFNDGTIIIKNGRLVDKYSINPLSDAFVLGDTRGNGISANLIYVYDENINNSNIGQDYIYAGRIDSIDKYSLTLNGYYILDKNEWVSFNKKKDPPFSYNDESYIYDLDKNKKLTNEELVAYEANRTNYYTYIYSDGNVIKGMYIKKIMDSLLTQRSTIGVVASKSTNPSTGLTLSVTSAKDWSDVKDRWMPKSSNINVNAEKTLIMKNGVRISGDEIKAGDRVYVVRDDLFAKILIIK